MSVPAPRHASRIVVPSGTVDRLAVDRRASTSARIDVPLTTCSSRTPRAGRSADSIAFGGGLAEAADAGVAHRLADVARAARGRPPPPSLRPRRCERLLLAHGADPARHALPARLVAEERRDPQQTGRRGRPCRRAPSRRPSRASRPARACPRWSSARSRSSGPDEAARRAAEQHRLQRPTRGACRRRARSARRA